MLVMGDGTGNVRTEATPKKSEAQWRWPANDTPHIGWAQQAGAGVLLSLCVGQLAMVCAGSMTAALAGAAMGGLIGVLAMRWVDATTTAAPPAAMPDEASMRALEEAQRTQHEVLARLRQISQATQDAARTARP